VTPAPGAWGKAIVYAPATVVVGDTRDWPDRGIRDVPHPGETVEAGHPLCTVLAQAPDRAACLAALRAETARVLTAVGTPAPEPEGLRRDPDGECV
jgi:predicted ATP-grasp superfamily ATP-dependent carboligase